jgi:hypothetical protein
MPSFCSILRRKLASISFLTQLLSNVEKQDENNISASAKTQDNNQQRIKIKTLEVRNISLKVNTKWLKTTLKIPNISAHNFGGNSGVPVNEIGKQVAKEIRCFQSVC